MQRARSDGTNPCRKPPAQPPRSFCLVEQRRRFTELRAALRTVTPKVLTQTLRDMARDGLILRHDFAENPPHVEYELTDLGRSLIVVIDAARAWGDERLNELIAARNR
nr:helix-turn-helix domain-containing protein [Occultella kanbiaonis]